jgi:hypothetical protein
VTPSILTLTLSALGKIDPIAWKYTRAYRLGNLELEGRREKKGVGPGFVMQMYKKKSIKVVGVILKLFKIPNVNYFLYFRSKILKIIRETQQICS